MYIFGASGHGKVIAAIVKADNVAIVEAFLDDNPVFETVLGIPVKLSASIEDYRNVKIIIAIGNNGIRKKIALRLEADYQIAIHPSAVVSSCAKIGKGTVAMANVSINPDAVVGNHCIINTGAVIEHDCILDDYVHVSPNAALAGEVTVGEGTHIGIGACVIQGIRIGKWATIGAGAVIINNVPDYSVVVGNPGKIIKYNDI